MCPKSAYPIVTIVSPWQKKIYLILYKLGFSKVIYKKITINFYFFIFDGIAAYNCT